ncbi:MAG: ABC transporter permease [Burkholderiales bacterium]|jgi:ABC-type nitrate/sulfonate/bicarbonate transport system permease component
MRRFGDLLLASLPFVVMIGIWQALAVYGGFPEKLVPSISQIFQTFFRLLNEGILLSSAVSTLYRLLLGFLISGVVGVFVGILMGRYRVIEETLLPLISFIYPIPGIAYAPLFVLWFGLGDLPSILLISFASVFPVIMNTWKGVKAVKPVWIRSATVMGAKESDIFRKIVLPGALPFILSGLRLGLAAAWRILVAVEMLMSVKIGLGWMIFGSQTFLNTDVMLATIILIGLIGVLMEKQIFERIERRTVVRWGMVRST